MGPIPIESDHRCEPPRDSARFWMGKGLALGRCVAAWVMRGEDEGLFTYVCRFRTHTCISRSSTRSKSKVLSIVFTKQEQSSMSSIESIETGGGERPFEMSEFPTMPDLKPGR